MQRTSSMCSLPSPPCDKSAASMDLDTAYQAVESTKLREAPKRPRMVIDEDDDEVDELDDDDDDDPITSRRLRPLPPAAASRPHLALGSPVNVAHAAGRGGASRKQLLNPFFLADTASASASRTVYSSSRPSYASHAQSQQPVASSSTSPVRHSRRRVDPDRIKLTTPPQKSRAELESERTRAEEEDAIEKKRREMGWDDPENPFLDRDDGMAKRLKDKEAPKRPETLTYVKRGERIRTSIPFTAVLTSSSPSEDPFTYTTPRLLFPPAAPKPPATPPSSFLEALRNSGSTSASAAVPSNPEPTVDKSQGARNELPPTPVTLKRKAPLRALGGGAGNGGAAMYKKMKLPSSEAEHRQRGLR
ncbi:hypothetical protein JCM10212_004732 [Sporobolomyces blumeae]